jgi:hypothetical protein
MINEATHTNTYCECMYVILTGAGGPGDQGLAAVAYREDRWCLDVVPFLAGERVDSVVIKPRSRHAISHRTKMIMYRRICNYET